LVKSGKTHFPGLIRLLFDAHARSRLSDDAEALAMELDVPPSFLADVDGEGLSLDADGRGKYLMSALCRAFPLSSALLGAPPGGTERLAAFLLSPDLFGTLGVRTAGFGRHLQRLASFEPDSDKRVQQAVLAVLDYERALAANAASVREAAAAGVSVPAPHVPDRATRRRGRLKLPAFTIVGELPQPMAALQAAMGGLSASDAWLRLEQGAVEWARIRAVIRSSPSPVTILARAHVTGLFVERGGAGGVAPLVDVSQRTVELRGRKGRWLQSLMGERVSDLPPAHKRLAEQLVEAGVLTVA